MRNARRQHHQPKRWPDQNQRRKEARDQQRGRLDRQQPHLAQPSHAAILRDAWASRREHGLHRAED
jgi:hypothetical protein